MAQRTMRPDQVEALFVSRAEAEASKGNLKTAEELFVLCGKEDQAISMYKRNQHWDEMIELVKESFFYFENYFSSTVEWGRFEVRFGTYILYLLKILLIFQR